MQALRPESCAEDEGKIQMSFAVPWVPSERPRILTIYLQFSPSMWALILIVSAVLAAVSTEPTLTLACVLVLVAGAKLLWRQGEPPILFAAFFLQWLQVSLAVFRASVYGVELGDLYFSKGAYLATWLSLFGLLALAAGIRLALSGVGQSAWPALIIEAQQCNLRKATGAYWIAQIVVVGIEAVTWWYPGLSQPLFALGNFRWIFFFFMAVVVFVQRRGYGPLILILIFELARGFLSYFSDYKDVFLVLALAYLTTHPKLKGRTLAVICLILGAVFVLSAAWSIVKDDYRTFMNGGTGQQVILVGPEERLTAIGDLMINKGLPALSEGFERLAKRVEYIHYFGRVVERVPNSLPHEYGALWGGAIMHVLTPRFLFPDKSALAADILTTQHYTGLKLTWRGNEYTEIPLGYMAESYIDFGTVGMFVPILLLGVLFGAQYRYIVTRTQHLMFAFGAAPVVVMPATHFEITTAKMLGSSITAFVVFVVAFHLIAPYLHRLVR
jgi:hypothetical protein